MMYGAYNCKFDKEPLKMGEFWEIEKVLAMSRSEQIKHAVLGSEEPGKYWRNSNIDRTLKNLDIMKTAW